MGETTTISWAEGTYNPIVADPAPGGKDRWSCTKISPGCDHCYASTLNHRFGGSQYASVQERGDDWPAVPVRLDEKKLLAPLVQWRTPRMLFLSSMTDVFGPWVPYAWLDQIFAVMALTPRHTYQVLTKRPSEMKKYLTHPDFEMHVIEQMQGIADAQQRYDYTSPTWPLPNVWLGVSVESNAYAWRAQTLLECPAALRFLSVEPLLGPVDRLSPYLTPALCAACHGTMREAVTDEEGMQHGWRSCRACEESPTGRGLAKAPIDWVICGGESGNAAAQKERWLIEPCPRQAVRWGPSYRTESLDALISVRVGGSGEMIPCPVCDGTGWKPRPEALGWVRWLRDACLVGAIPFHYQQWGGRTNHFAGRMLDGREHLALPV